MRTILRDDRGITLLLVLLVMTLILSTTGASLFFGGLNSRISSNIKTGRGAMHAADAGIQHALATVPIGTNFNGLLAGSVSGFPLVDGKPTLTGSLGGYTYTVVVDNDTSVTGETTTSDNNRIVILTSTATGSTGSQAKVRAYVGRSTATWVPPGAIYVPAGSNSDADFNTSGTFLISGNDTNYSGDGNGDGRADSTSAGPNAPIYGVAPLYDSIVNEFLNSLTSTEKTRVQGKGYNGSTSPVTPSVFKSTVSFSVSDLANSFKNNAGAVQYLNGYHVTSTDCPSPPVNPPPSSCRFGTDASPQITYVKSDTSTIKFDSGSTVTGSGVLILDGKANVFGNFEFHGLVISLAPGPRGDESTEDKLKLKLKNNARILGSLILGPTGEELKFDIKDTAAVYYSSQGTNLVQANWGSLLPQPAKLIGWHELMN
ncbi:MAG: hypothetical protein HYT78_10255 [Deltaproteobacteria bacterium]|nr:hypothetical protein [Deltaproteobacteria bacterium]